MIVLLSLSGQREAPLKIKLEAISDSTKESFSQETTSSKTHSVHDPHSTDLTRQTKSNIQRQFSIVKKNAIQLNSLPRPVNNTTKHLKKSKLSKTPTKLRQNSKGEKKRRFSRNGQARSKQEGKSVRLSEQNDPTMASWSPVHKRHAPERKLKDDTSDIVDNKISENETSKVLALKLPASDLASKEEQKTFIEAGEGKPVCLQIKQEKRTSREEGVYELSSENLFFSFKEELLKRAFETNEKDSGEVECEKKEDKVADSGFVSNLNECQKEVGSLGNSISLGCHTLVSGSEVKVSEEGKLLEHSVVADDATTWSHESGSCELKTAPVITKSVRKLRERFLNIDDMIEEKNKTNLAKKSQEIQRELRCVSTWKQQTGSHGEVVRKLSMGKMAAKTTDLRMSSVGMSRRSVKELRKRYMGSGNDDSNGSKEKLHFVRSKSMKAAVNMERNSSASRKEEIPSETSHGKSEKNTDSTVLEGTKVILVQNKSNCDEAEECSGQSEKSVTDAKSTANACVGGVLQYSENQVSGCYKQNSNLTDQVGSLIEEKCTTSEDLQSKVPSLQIRPASPESVNGQQNSPGLKRIAASHDSGIDEPPMFVQSNSLNSETDKKISAESLKIAAEFSFSGSGTNELSLNLQPSKSEPVTSLPSPDIPLSLSSGSDTSAVEVFWSLPLSAGRRTSLTDTSSSCSSPRMSVVIAQEAATTKINSRYFTVESTEPWDFEDYRIAEEHQCVMEVEGEFSFGREKRRTSRAERQAIYSLHRDAKNLCLNETGLIKEDDVTLSPMEIDAELQTLEVKHGLLERRGVEIEHQLRESMDCKYT